MTRTVTILLPNGELEGPTTRLAPRLASLKGKRIGFIDNELWRSMHILCDELGKVFTTVYGAVGTETLYINPLAGKSLKAYETLMQGFSRKVDVAVSGLGN